MDDQKNEQLKQKLFSLLAGIASGVFMATVILFLMNHFQVYSFSGSAWRILLVIACLLPWWLDFLKHRGFIVMLVEGVMVLVSFVICFLYGNAIAKNEIARTNLVNLIMITHAVAFLFTALRVWVMHYRSSHE